jgi:hypothetical protein
LWIDVAAEDPTRILAHSAGPVLTLGDIGDFDDSGANPSSLVSFKGQRLMFYTGWQRHQRAPYSLFTGVAVEASENQFCKHARVPVLDRTNEEPHIRAAPFVLSGDKSLRMWYVSSNRWIHRGDRLHYDVAIHHAESDDGVRWTVTAPRCLVPDAAQGEYAIGRPSVLIDEDRYRMWYSIRSHRAPYSMGYAESPDGLHWTRMDRDVGIARSPDGGWDSEMICYPSVIRAGGQLLMFYNGNQHGRTGFGCAQISE